MSRIVTAIGLAASAGIAAAGTITPGIPEVDFSGGSIEKFQEAFVSQSSYTWASGLQHASQNGADLQNYTGGYGMGFAPLVDGGKDNDGYFGTGPSPQTFELVFPVPSYLVGWYGAESDVGEPGHRDALWTLSFYNASNVLIATIDEPTPSNVHAWDQFHGFLGSEPIARVVFEGAGHMVLDDVQWAVPAPGAAVLLGLAGLASARRRRA